MKLTFPARWRNEDDNWSTDGPSITSDGAVTAIKAAIKKGPIIVEHGHYRGGCAPTRRVFEDWEEFEAYMESGVFAGDTIDVWAFSAVCDPKRRVASGKCPAEDGTVPEAGAY